MFICSPRPRSRYLYIQRLISDISNCRESGILVKAVGWSDRTRCWLCSSSDVPSELAANARSRKMNWLFEKKKKKKPFATCRVCAEGRRGGIGRQTPTDTVLKNSGSCAVAPSTSLWPADFIEAVARVTLTPAGPGVSLAFTEMTCPMKCWEKKAHTDALFISCVRLVS